MVNEILDFSHLGERLIQLAYDKPDPLLHPVVMLIDDTTEHDKVVLMVQHGQLSRFTISGILNPVHVDAGNIIVSHHLTSMILLTA